MADATVFAVLQARLAGLERIREGRMPYSAMRRPISGASRLPRLFNGRSRSRSDVSFQLDLAWRTIVSVFMALTSCRFAGGPPRSSYQRARAGRTRVRRSRRISSE